LIAPPCFDHGEHVAPALPRLHHCLAHGESDDNVAANYQSSRTEVVSCELRLREPVTLESIDLHPAGTRAKSPENVMSRLHGKYKRDNGRGGIRTHGTLLTYTHFPGVRLKPLGHPSRGSLHAPPNTQDNNGAATRT
jgi:hypothetical protein